MLSKYATKADLFKMAKFRFDEVTVEGNTFRLKSLDSKSRIHIELIASEVQEDFYSYSKLNHYLVMYSLVDAKGKRLFTDDEVGKVEELPTEIVEPIFKKAMQLNNLMPASLDDTKKN